MTPQPPTTVRQPFARTRGRRLLGAVVAALTLTVACSKTSPPANGTAPAAANVQANALEADETPKNGGALVVGVMAETTGWNVHRSLWSDAANFAGSSVLEPLTMFDKDGKAQPWLLASYEPTNAGSFDAWTLTVRPGITFHDGTVLDATVVAANLNSARSQSLAGVATGYMFNSIEADGPMKVSVKLTQPWAAFGSYLGNISGYMMSPAMLTDERGMNDNPIGTGPYKTDRWIPDKSFKVKRNDNYWGSSKPHLDSIEFRPITDNNTRENSIRSGELDLLYTARGGNLASMQQAGFAVVTDFDSEKTFVMLNTAEGPQNVGNPFTNIHARRALAYGTDTEALRSIISPNLPLSRSTQIQLASGPFGMDEAATGYPTYDPAKAREAIEAYKKDTGAASLKFTFTGLASPDDQQVQQVLKAQWDQLGMDVELKSLEQGAYVLQQATGQYQAGFFRNYAYPDPESNYYFFHSRTAKGVGNISVNFHQLKVPAIDDALDASRRTTDQAERKKYMQTLTTEVNKALVDIWLYNTAYALVASPKVRGLNPARQQPFGNNLAKTWLWVSIWKQPS